MSSSLEMVMDEAIAWHLGLEQAGADEWRCFVAWLEADVRHQDAYDRVTMDDAALAAVVIEPIEAAPRAPVRSAHHAWVRWGGMGGGLLAAAAAAWMALMPAVTGNGVYSIATAPGQHRQVTLPDGTRVDLNGASKLTLDRGQPRVAMLDAGEAVFHVVHHADRPFEVRAGGVTLQDVGTVFNVARNGARLRVAVAEGEVLYQPKADAVSLRRGMTLVVRDGEDHATVGRIEPASVGGWAQGRLEFRDATLASVAEDVTRSTGARLAVDPAIADQPFTGTLRLDRAPDAVVRSLAGMAGGTLRRDGPGWTMLPKQGGAR